MCLVFIAIQTAGNAPLLIGANREESRRRPATSPVCCRRGGLRCLIAGADHGPDGSFPEMGTWLGVNELGLAVAVTNRSDGELAWADQIRSRGLLVVELLGCASAAQAVREAQCALAQPGFGGCNVLVAQPVAAFVVQAPGAGRISCVQLPVGVHAMTNLEIDDASDPRIRFVQSNLVAADFRASAGRICRDDSIIRGDSERGTVSSSLIEAGKEIALYHVEGDPRGRPYVEYRLPVGHCVQQGISICQEPRL